MKFLNNRWKKYLLLLPMVYLVISTLMYKSMTEKINAALLQQKYNAVVHDIDILSVTIDRFAAEDGNWGDSKYTSPIAAGTEYIYNLHHVFAAAYLECDGCLGMLSAQYAEDDLFDPRNYQEFTDAVGQNESGFLRLKFYAGGLPTREMWLYFKWLPTDLTLDGRYLIAAAVSLDSVVVPMASQVAYTQLINIGIMFILTTALVIIVVRLTAPAPAGKAGKYGGNSGGGEQSDKL